MAARSRSSTDENTDLTLAALQDSLAAQAERIDAQQTQIDELRERQNASAEKQRQILSLLERLVATITRQQQDLLSQLRDSLQSLSEQDEDTRRMAVVVDETDSLPAAQPDIQPDSQPAQTADDDPDLDFVYTPVEVAAEQEEEDTEAAPVPPPKPIDEQIKVMRVFIDANADDIRFVDYIGEDLPKSQVNKLEAKGLLERHRFHPYKLRPTALGRKWFDQATAPPAPVDEPSAPAETPAAADSIPEMQLVVEEGEAGRAVKIRIRPDDEQSALDDTQPLPAIDDAPPSLDGVFGAPGSDYAKLLTLLMGLDWAASEADLRAAFPRSVFISALIDDINDLAHDSLGDNLILVDDQRYVVDADFRAAVASSLNASPTPV